MEVLFLALAVSMDAFAVAIGLGSKHKINRRLLATMSALYFGVFQGLMPFIGYLGGQGVLGWVKLAAPWIAFILLFLIGGKMIYESFTEGIEEDISKITHRVMLLLAIATSVDAMAAGFAIPLLDFNPILACLLIATITALFSYLGVLVGAKYGTKLESKAELLGGVVLILISLKIILI